MPERRYLCADVVAHADWSKDPRKRWVAIARWCNDRFVADAPRPAWRDPEFFDCLGPALVGFDFPIGLPRAYAARAGISSFINALPYLSDVFYTVAERPEQISLQRPFYPRIPGGTSHAQLLFRLGIWHMKDLLRLCDSRSGAAPLFWTLGPRQPGPAAIAGWRDLVGPALRRDAIRIWPFQGRLQDLVQGDKTVVVEAYPAEAYIRLGMSPSFGKQDQQKRAAAGRMLVDWADYWGVELTQELHEQVADGFGADGCGEDRFDAVAGLLGMLDIALGITRPNEPDDRIIREIEGWIIGLTYETPQLSSPEAAPAGDTSRQL